MRTYGDTTDIESHLKSSRKPRKQPAKRIKLENEKQYTSQLNAAIEQILPITNPETETFEIAEVSTITQHLNEDSFNTEEFQNSSSIIEQGLQCLLFYFNLNLLHSSRKRRFTER